MSIEMSFSGIEELSSDLEKMVRKFPETSRIELRKNANAMKRAAKSQMNNDIKHHVDNIIPAKWDVKEVSIGLSTTFMVFNKAPHAHLVEFGHEEYDFRGNPTGGFVEGTHSLEKTKNEYERIMPERFEKMLDDILRSNNL